MRPLVLWLLLAPVALVGCTSPPPTGGVEGTVWIGPTCPVVQNPPDPECDDRRFETPLVLVRAGTDEVAGRFSSDANGTFLVPAHPDTYEIRRPPDAGQPPSCHAGPFQVEADRYTHVTVTCDSGIR